MKDNNTKTVVRHRKNPFIKDAVIHTVKGISTIYGSPSENVKDAFAMVNRQDGEDFGDISFGKRIIVDKTSFLKFYANGVKMFLGLKTPGIKVFMLIYDILLQDENYQAEYVDLMYEALTDEQKEDVKKSTFYRGINELKKANFLAEAIIRGRYWINIDYVFRGKRLTLVNQYILDGKEQEHGNEIRNTDVENHTAQRSLARAGKVSTTRRKNAR